MPNKTTKQLYFRKKEEEWHESMLFDQSGYQLLGFSRSVVKNTIFAELNMLNAKGV